MAKIIKNIDTVEHTYAGQGIPAAESYTLQANEDVQFSTSDSLIADIVNGKAQMNDGVADISGTANQLDFLKSEVKEVTTQFEKNDKTTKLAKAKATVDANTKKATVLIKVPGTPGSGDGRWISGGFAIAEDYDKDDFATARIKDEDRLIAWQLALEQDPNSIAPLSDEDVIAVGTVPVIGDVSNYPYIRSYTEEEMEPENEGWYFWPVAMGNNIAPAGETEVEALGGYGFLPSGFYLEIKYHRETLTTGCLRVNFAWGKQG